MTTLPSARIFVRLSSRANLCSTTQMPYLHYDDGQDNGTPKEATIVKCWIHANKVGTRYLYITQELIAE